MRDRQEWGITIKVKGPKPSVRVLCGDTIFVSMTEEGQSATYTVKKKPKKVVTHGLSARPK